jgi:hypothetical protein
MPVYPEIWCWKVEDENTWEHALSHSERIRTFEYMRGQLLSCSAMFFQCKAHLRIWVHITSILILLGRFLRICRDGVKYDSIAHVSSNAKASNHIRKQLDNIRTVLIAWKRSTIEWILYTFDLRRRSSKWWGRGKRMVRQLDVPWRCCSSSKSCDEFGLPPLHA